MADKAKTKCAFSSALAYVLCFVSANDKILFAIAKILNSNAKILFAISNFIVSVDKILFTVCYFFKDYAKILFSVREDKLAIVKNKTAKLNFAFGGFTILFSLSNFEL